MQKNKTPILNRGGETLFSTPFIKGVNHYWFIFKDILWIQEGVHMPSKYSLLFPREKEIVKALRKNPPYLFCFSTQNPPEKFNFSIE